MVNLTPDHIRTHARDDHNCFALSVALKLHLLPLQPLQVFSGPTLLGVLCHLCLLHEARNLKEMLPPDSASFVGAQVLKRLLSHFGHVRELADDGAFCIFHGSCCTNDSKVAVPEARAPTLGSIIKAFMGKAKDFLRSYIGSPGPCLLFAFARYFPTCTPKVKVSDDLEVLKSDVATKKVCTWSKKRDS